jgi:predicted nuclease with TOPRIM domain
MNANELADLLDFDAKTLNWKAFADAATMLRQQQEQINNLQQWEKRQLDVIEGQQAEIEALKKRVEEVKDTNGQLVDLVQLHREEAEKMRNQILAWENAEVPTEVMADIIEELERRGFITK